MYTNRKKLTNLRIKPYLTKRRHDTLEACRRYLDKDRSDGNYVGEYVHYIFADVDGNLKFYLHEPHRGKRFFVFRTEEDFLNKVEQSIIFKRNDFFNKCGKHFEYD